jgi:hypothetical protein
LARVVAEPYLDFAQMAEDTITKMYICGYNMTKLSLVTDISATALSCFLNAKTNLSAHNTARLMMWLQVYDVRHYVLGLENVGKD